MLARELEEEGRLVVGKELLTRVQSEESAGGGGREWEERTPNLLVNGDVLGSRCATYTVPTEEVESREDLLDCREPEAGERCVPEVESSCCLLTLFCSGDKVAVIDGNILVYYQFERVHDFNVATLLSAE